MPVDVCRLGTIETLWGRMIAPADHQHNVCAELLNVMEECAAGALIALLVLQPADWLTWEGTLNQVAAPEVVLARWADALPPGWVGIPMHHPDTHLSEALESSLAAAFPNLKPLPPHLSTNTAEWALAAADAVVTVSSTVAASALIAGKHVVVAPRSAFSGLASTSVESLQEPTPSLSRTQRAALLSFLSHRYSLPMASALNAGGSLMAHLEALVAAPDALEWLLDLTDWSPSHLESLI